TKRVLATLPDSSAMTGVAASATRLFVTSSGSKSELWVMAHAGSSAREVDPPNGAVFPASSGTYVTGSAGVQRVDDSGTLATVFDGTPESTTATASGLYFTACDQTGNYPCRLMRADG